MGEGEPDIEELLIAYESQKNVIQQLQVNTGQLQVKTGGPQNGSLYDDLAWKVVDDTTGHIELFLAL